MAARTQADSPEVGLLRRRPDNKRDVAVLPLLLPDVEGRSFQHVSVHRHHGSNKLSSEREVGQVSSGPGRVLVPGDGLAKMASIRLKQLTSRSTALFSVSLCWFLSPDWMIRHRLVQVELS